MARNDNSDLDWFKHQEDDPDRLYETRSDGVIVVGYIMQDIFTIALISMASAPYYYRAFSRLDLEYEIVEMPRARALINDCGGHTTCGCLKRQNPERAEHSYFIPYLAQRNEILVRADADVEYRRRVP